VCVRVRVSAWCVYVLTQGYGCVYTTN
jgi:hypothetical protein